MSVCWRRCSFVHNFNPVKRISLASQYKVWQSKANKINIETITDKHPPNTERFRHSYSRFRLRQKILIEHQKDSDQNKTCRLKKKKKKDIDSRVSIRILNLCSRQWIPWTYFLQGSSKIQRHLGVESWGA